MRSILSVILLAATTATAAPPPGHPTPHEAGQALGFARPNYELTREGEVLQAIDSNDYTYVEVREAGGKRWLATTRTPLVVGSRVRYGEGVTMVKFYSKVLKKTFPEITFVQGVEPKAVARRP